MSPARLLELARARRHLANVCRAMYRWERTCTAAGAAGVRRELDAARLHLMAIAVRSGRNTFPGRLAAASLAQHEDASAHLAQLERGLTAYERGELGAEDVGTPGERAIVGLAAIEAATERARSAAARMRLLDEQIGQDGRAGGVGQDRWHDLRHAFDEAFAILFDATLERLHLDPAAPDPRRPDGEVEIYRAACDCLDAAEDLVRRQAE
jgi:hypothetical protein